MIDLKENVESFNQLEQNEEISKDYLRTWLAGWIYPQLSESKNSQIQHKFLPLAQGEYCPRKCSTGFYAEFTVGRSCIVIV